MKSQTIFFFFEEHEELELASKVRNIARYRSVSFGMGHFVFHQIIFFVVIIIIYFFPKYIGRIYGMSLSCN